MCMGSAVHASRVFGYRGRSRYDAFASGITEERSAIVPSEGAIRSDSYLKTGVIQTNSLPIEGVITLV